MSRSIYRDAWPKEVVTRIAKLMTEYTAAITTLNMAMKKKEKGLLTRFDENKQ